MNDIGAELYELISAEFAGLIADLSPRLKTFADVQRYAGKLGRLLSRSLARHITDSVLPDGMMYYNIAEKILAPLLRQNQELVNAAASQVQSALDARQGLHIASQLPEFPEERLQRVLNAVTGQDAQRSTEIMSRAGETMTRSFVDDYVEENAQFRTEAGVQCYITRTTDGNPCAWCASLAGRYRYPEDIPDDIFRRHDNCGCVVEYECGDMRQNAHTKKTYTAEQAREKEEAVPPKVRYTPAEAERREQEVILRSKPGGNDSAIADMEYINSQAFADKFKGKYANEDVEQAVVSACRQIVKNRNGTEYEEAFFIDARTGKTISYVKGKQKNGIEMPDELKKRLTNAPEGSIIMIHNHPNSSPLSSTDYLTSTKYKSLYETVACGHNGDVFAFRGTYGTAGEQVVMLDGTVECESVRDFRMLYSKYLARGCEDYEARHLSWTAVMQNRGFFYEKR